VLDACALSGARTFPRSSSRCNVGGFCLGRSR
jgi:hypothetical protein